MKKGTHRILAMLLLAFTLITLSGVASTAATLVDAQTHSSCCDADSKYVPVGDDAPTGDDAPRKGPCSTPDCSCFSCINLILPDRITLTHPSALEIFLNVPPQQVHLSGYAPSIEYPPEAA